MKQLIREDDGRIEMLNVGQRISRCGSRISECFSKIWDYDAV